MKKYRKKLLAFFIAAGLIFLFNQEVIEAQEEAVEEKKK